MPKDWKGIWDPRAKAFNKVCQKYPNARNDERNPLIDILQIEAPCDFLEVAPCGGCLLRGVHDRYPNGITYFAVEPSDENASDLPDYVTRIQGADITSFAMPDGSVDRVGNLAGLHHTHPRKGYYAESFRVLRPGGIMAIADVKAGTQVDHWLNEFVNQYCAYGHEGYFFPAGEMSADMLEAGFTEVREDTLKLAWHFDSVAGAVDFCRHLFFLTKATDENILTGLKNYLGFDPDAKNVRIPWELTYASGRKPGVAA